MFVNFKPYSFEDTNQNNIASEGTQLCEIIKKCLEANNKIYNPFQSYISYSVFSTNSSGEEPWDRFIHVNGDFALYCVESKEDLNRILDNIPNGEKLSTQLLLDRFFDFRMKYLSLQEDPEKLKDFVNNDIDIQHQIVQLLSTYNECLTELGFSLSSFEQMIVATPKIIYPESFLILFLEMILNLGTIYAPESWQGKRKCILLLNMNFIMWYNNNFFVPHYEKIVSILKAEDLPLHLVKHDRHNLRHNLKINLAPRGTKLYYMIEEHFKNIDLIFNPSEHYIYADSVNEQDTDKYRMVRINTSILHIFQKKSFVLDLQKELLDNLNPDENEVQFYVNCSLDTFLDCNQKQDLNILYLWKTLDTFIHMYKKCVDHFKVSSGFAQFFKTYNKFRYGIFQRVTYLCMMMEFLLNFGSEVCLSNDKMKKRFLHFLSPHLEFFALRQKAGPTAYKNVLLTKMPACKKKKSRKTKCINQH